MRFSKDDLEELLENLDDVLESADACLEAGDKTVESLRPVLSKALKILLKALNDTNMDLEPELEVFSSLKAKGMRRDYSNYVKAGFSKDQAFTLVLASVKPANFTVTEILKSASRSIPDKKKD
jgi:hypothetical protein